MKVREVIKLIEADGWYLIKPLKAAIDNINILQNLVA